MPVIGALLGRPDGAGEAGFDGTATELLGKLRDICSEAQQRARWFPNTAAAAGTHLRRIAPLLDQRGIAVVRDKTPDRNRTRKTKIFCRSPETLKALRARFGWTKEERT